MNTRKRGRRDQEETEYPCIECRREVRQRQQALECDTCSRWQHRVCRTGVTLEEYRTAMRHGMEWNCEECTANQTLPTNEMTNRSGFDESFPFTSRSSLDYQPESVHGETGEIESELSFNSLEPVHESTRLSLPSDVNAPGHLDEMPSALEEPSFDEVLVEEHEPTPDVQVQDEEEEVSEEEGGHEAITYQLLQGASQRAQPKLVDSQGYIYGIKYRGQERITWRCSVRNSTLVCMATVRQEGGNYHPGPRPHLHQPKPGEIHRVVIRKKLKRQAKQHPFKSGQVIAEEVLLSQGQLQHAPKLNSMARMANRRKEQRKPKEPTSLDFDLREDFIPDGFLVKDIRRNQKRTVIMATDEQLALLARARTWYIDGTFKVVREPFHQLVSIHAFAKNGDFQKQVPLGYLLLSGKRTTEYKAALQALKEALPTQANVQEVMMDFEKGLWKAVRQVFPEVRILGCAFHWKQAVWRHMQQVGCTNLYRRGQDTRDVMKELLSLPYLPADQIVPVFEEMRQSNDDQRLEEVFRYLNETWIRNPSYPIEAWSAYGRAVRTNNDCEGWHHRLNGRAGGKALGVYGLMGLLHREAAVVDMTVTLINLKRLSKRMKKKSATMQGHVFRLWAQYEDGSKTATELLRACSHVHGNVNVPQ